MLKMNSNLPLLILYGNFQLGYAITLEAVVTAIYVYGNDFHKLKPGYFFTENFIFSTDLFLTTKNTTQYWLIFWFFAMLAGIDRIATETRTPESFQAIFKNFIALYQIQSFFNFFCNTTLPDLYFVADQINIYLTASIASIQQSFNPPFALRALPSPKHALTQQQAKIVEDFIQMIERSVATTEPHKYMQKILHYGNFGMQDTVFSSHIVQAAIYVYEPQELQQLQKIDFFENLLHLPEISGLSAIQLWKSIHWNIYEMNIENAKSMTTQLLNIWLLGELRVFHIDPKIGVPFKLSLKHIPYLYHKQLDIFKDLLIKNDHERKSATYLQKLVAYPDKSLPEDIFIHPIFQTALMIFTVEQCLLMHQFKIFEKLYQITLQDHFEVTWWLRFWKFFDTTALNDNQNTSPLHRIERYLTCCKHPLVQAAMDFFDPSDFQCLEQKGIFAKTINDVLLNAEGAHLFWKQCTGLRTELITLDNADYIANQLANAYQIFFALEENYSISKLNFNINHKTTHNLTSQQAIYIVQQWINTANRSDFKLYPPQQVLDTYIHSGNFGLSDEIFCNPWVQAFLLQYSNYTDISLLLAHKLPARLATYPPISMEQIHKFWKIYALEIDNYAVSYEIQTLFNQLHNALILFIAEPCIFDKNAKIYTKLIYTTSYQLSEVQAKKIIAYEKLFSDTETVNAVEITNKKDYLLKIITLPIPALQDVIFIHPLFQTALIMFSCEQCLLMHKFDLFNKLYQLTLHDHFEVTWWLRFWQFFDATALNDSHNTPILDRLESYLSCCKHPLVQAAMNVFKTTNFKYLEKQGLFAKIIKIIPIDPEWTPLFIKRYSNFDVTSITPDNVDYIANQLANAYQIFFALKENHSIYMLNLDIDCRTTHTLTTRQAAYIVQQWITTADTSHSKDHVLKKVLTTYIHFGGFGLSDEVFCNPWVHVFLLHYYNHRAISLLPSNCLSERLATYTPLSMELIDTFWQLFKLEINNNPTSSEIEVLFNQLHNALVLFIADPSCMPKDRIFKTHTSITHPFLSKTTISKNYLLPYALSAPQAQALVTFIAPEKDTFAKISFIQLIIHYGNLGLGSKSKMFDKPYFLRFLYDSCTYNYAELSHTIEQGYLNNDWLSRLDNFKDKPLKWWNQHFGIIFWNWIKPIANKAQFDFITINYLALLAQEKPISIYNLKPLDMQLFRDDKQKKTTLLHQNTAQQIAHFIQQHGLNDNQTSTLLHYVLHYGNFQQPERIAQSLLWGLVTIPQAMVAWYAQDTITPALLDKLPPEPEKHHIAFWKLLHKIVGSVKKPQHFQALFERVFNIYFEARLFEQELPALESFNNYTNFEKIIPDVTKPAHFNEIKALLLREDTCTLADALPNIADYFIALGSFLPHQWHTQRNLRIAIATLGASFGWYATQETALSKILAIIPEETTQLRDVTWIAQFWEFFRYLQQHKPRSFLNAPLFDQYIACWKNLCEFDDELLSALLNYLQIPQQAEAFFSNTTTQDAKFNQLCQFFHAENFAAIETRPTPSLPDFNLFSQNDLLKLLKNVSLAEWMVFRNGLTIQADAVLSDIAHGIAQGQEQTTFQTLVAEKQRFIHSIIASQMGQAHLWLRELIQNALDALRKTQLKHPEQTTHLSIDVAQYCYDNKQDGLDFVITITDSAGMSFVDIANYLLIPGSSDPEKQKYQLLGIFGMGFYTIFQDADIVEIKSSIGDNTCCELRIIVERDTKHIQPRIAYFYQTPNAEQFQGTVIRHIKTYAKQNALSAHLQGLSIAHQINYLAGGLLAPTYMVQADTILPVPAENPITITYNQLPVAHPKRELLAQIPIQRLGINPDDIEFLQMFQQDKLPGRIEQHGLFVSALGYPWNMFVPLILQQEIGNHIVIVLPKSAHLTSDRSGIAKEHMPVILKAMFVLYTQALINRCVQHNHVINTLPRDFYLRAQTSYANVNKEITDVCHVINLALDERNHGAGYACWDKLTEEDLEKFIHQRLWTVQLLTLINENKLGVRFNLTNIVTKDIEAIPVSCQFKQNIQAVAEHISNMILVKTRTIPSDEWDAPQKIFAAIMQEIYRRTGIGFSQTIYYHNPNSLTTAQVSPGMGHLIGHGIDEDIVFPICVNTGTDLYKKRVDTLLARDYTAMIYDENAENFVRTFAHEAAHTLEFKHQLNKALRIIDDYDRKNLQTMPAELIQALKHAVRCHFIASQEDESEFSVQLAEIKTQYDHVPGINDLRDALSIWAANYIAHNESNCWTHNKDEELETSFINQMKTVLFTWVRYQVFIDFPAMLDSLRALYPCEDPNPSSQEETTENVALDNIEAQPLPSEPASPSIASNSATFFARPQQITVQQMLNTKPTIV